MPAVRRWRVLVFSILSTSLTIYYWGLGQEYWWNYANSLYPPSNLHGNRIQWKSLPLNNPVTSYIPLPSGRSQNIPQVQAPAPHETKTQRTERLRRRNIIKESFNHSWHGYKKYAWLRDEVTPISGKYKDVFGGWAATLVDSLDSLWIMGMKDEFENAVSAAIKIDFSTTDQRLINVFETTIRYLGGFLAAYDVSGRKYEGLLAKASEIGELLIRCFDTPNRMPISRWDWREYISGKPQAASKTTLLSEIGSLSLEFTRLSQLTGDHKFYDAIQRIYDELEKSQDSTKLPGMWPVTIDATKPSFDTNNFFTLGGMSDSLYEYLPKQYLLLGGQLSQPRRMYENFIPVAKKHLFSRFFNEKNEKLMVSGDVRISNSEIHKESRGQHLTCFTGGMVALGSKVFSRPEDLDVAEELTLGCTWAYEVSPNGIAPEIYSVLPCPQNDTCIWDNEVYKNAINTAYSENTPTTSMTAQRVLGDIGLPKGFTSVHDHRYLLRPEAIESVFILYRITGKQSYADTAWRMFQAIEKITRTPIAAASISDVMADPANKTATIDDLQIDSMESFWLAETLKYFYLCFEEWDMISLDKWVLNTEAHPFRRP